LPSSNREDFLQRLPLYAGELLLGSMALAALTFSLQEPLYSALVHGAFTVAIFSSLAGASRGRVWVLPGALFFLIPLVMYALRQMLPLELLFLYPAEALSHEDMLLATLIGWFLVGFGFWQGSRLNLIFLVVCGLAIFGLMGTINLNPEMWLCFTVFVLAAVFCWGYEQFLELDDRLATQGQPRTGAWLEMLRGHLAVAVLVAVLTLSLGSALGLGVYKVSPNLYAQMAQRAYGWDPTPRIANIFNSFQDEFQVSTGPVRLLPVPALEVKADHPALWRGLVYDYYNGRGWTRSARDGQVLEGEGGRFAVPEPYLPPSGYRRTNRQQVEIQTYPGVLFAAAQPAEVQLTPEALPEGDWPRSRRLEPVLDAYGSLTWAGREMEAARRYTVVSLEPTQQPELLRRTPQEYPASISESYLQVPVRTELALQGLVGELTATAENPYDKALALQGYLEANCLYSLSAPATPRGQDVASHFVLESRRGACDAFSTSLAIMLRLADVPARVATGYATGTYNAEKEAYVALGTDAHAWVEVYFTGVGWVPFDPQATDVFEHQSLAELLTGGYWNLAVGQMARRLGLLALVALIALVALSALWDPLQGLKYLWRPRSQSPRQRFAQDYQALYQLLLRRLGRRPEPSLTPREAVALVAAQLPPGELPRRLVTLNERFYALRYAATVTAEELLALRRELQELRRALRRVKR
jgi:transglutaminase-like putative cysteine protease